MGVDGVDGGSVEASDAKVRTNFVDYVQTSISMTCGA
jgi:hypothetical protein